MVNILICLLLLGSVIPADVPNQQPSPAQGLEGPQHLKSELFRISWSTVSSGGSGTGFGNCLKLRGAIEQVNPGHMAGSDFVLQGRFRLPNEVSPIFSDGFETGGLECWSGAVGKHRPESKQ